MLITKREDRAIWNTLIDQEHPRGVTMLAGAQLTYLIQSKHGYWGAIGFSSAALYLEARTGGSPGLRRNVAGSCIASPV